ncbi:hypothetical protein [Streptomyces sp. NPDC005507]|uniref:hypothetical protein n=1 Tax=unclassified Streptomyces TaxID=2593676 RepID=UPI0033A494CF
MRETSLKAVLDDRTRVEGLTGTVFGPARLEGSGPPRELAGPALGEWLNNRGAAVQVLNSRTDPRTAVSSRRNPVHHADQHVFGPMIGSAA